MLSKSASKRLSIDDSGSSTIESGTGDMTSESLTAAGEPVSVQALAETESVNNFMHNADHLSFVVKDISTGSDVFGTDDNLTNDGSLGTRS